MLKQILIIIAFCLTTSCASKVNAQITTSCENELITQDFSSSISESVADLLDGIDCTIIDTLFFDDKPFMLSGLYIEYENNIVLEIWPESYGHVIRFREKLDWSIDDFRLETVKYIAWYRDDDLLSEFGDKF